MRDSLSAFDQVRAFAGDTFTIEDVTSVLGLVGRDLVFDVLDAVAAEDGAAAFALVESAIERGYDLRILCRELARATRDLLLVSVDPARLKDPDVAGEAERPRLTAIGGRYSREDLLRAFDAFTRAEFDVRHSDHPRFQLEMALLRLMHLRKLVPLAELLEGGGGRAPSPLPRGTPAAAARPPAAASAGEHPRPSGRAGLLGLRPRRRGRGGADGARERYLAAIKSGKRFFFNAVVAQAYRIDVTPSEVTFAFLPNQKVPRAQCEENREWLTSLAAQTLGRDVAVQVTTVIRPSRRPRRRRQPRRRGGPAAAACRRPPATTNCARRRWPIPACRRCSRSSPSNAPRSRRCKATCFQVRSTR